MVNIRHLEPLSPVFVKYWQFLEFSEGFLPKAGREMAQESLFNARESKRDARLLKKDAKVSKKDARP